MKTKTLFAGLTLAFLLASWAAAYDMEYLISQLRPDYFRQNPWPIITAIMTPVETVKTTTTTSTTLQYCSWFYLEDNSMAYLDAITLCDCGNESSCNFTLRSFGMRADVQSIPYCNNKLNITVNCRKMQAQYVKTEDKCPA